MLSQQPLDRDAQPGSHALLDLPVDRHVVPRRRHQLARDLLQRMVAEVLYRAVLGVQRIVGGNEPWMRRVRLVARVEAEVARLTKQEPASFLNQDAGGAHGQSLIVGLTRHIVFDFLQV